MMPPPFTLTPPANVDVAVEVETSDPTVSTGVPVAVSLVPLYCKSSPFVIAVVSRPIVPVVVIVPPVRPAFVATDETEAFEVLHVPEPVIGPVPFPVRQPVRVEAPVPPFATVKALVRVRVPPYRFVAVRAVDEAYGKTEARVDVARKRPARKRPLFVDEASVVAVKKVFTPENVLLSASKVVEAEPPDPQATPVEVRIPEAA